MSEYDELFPICQKGLQVEDRGNHTWQNPSALSASTNLAADNDSLLGQDVI